MIVFDKCSNETSEVTCKSDAEINEWMQYKYILVYLNQKKFVQHKFDSERLQMKADTVWLALNEKTRTDYVFTVQRTAMELSDNYFSFQNFFTDIMEGFTVERSGRREMGYKNRYQNSITFEMSLK